MKTPEIPQDEKGRLEALRLLEILDTVAEERFDRITKLAALLLDVPICALSLVDAHRQWFKSIQGLDVTETSRDVSFCGHAILGSGLMVVENAAEDERFADNPLVAGDPGIRFYAGQPIRTSSGHRVGTLCVIDRKPRDLGEQHRETLAILAGIVESELRAREEIQKYTREIERSRQAALEVADQKADFFAHMSHEIRGPMMSILGYVDLLGGSKTSEEDRREYVDIIKASGEHLLALVNDILDHAKVEAGQMDVERIPVNIVSLLTDVRRLMNIRAKERGISLRMCICGSIPESIESDPVRLRQILVNLVSNAIKFTEQGFVEIRAWMETPDRLHLGVRDTGIGMTEEQVQSVFDPFKQAASDTTRKFGGTGLGLAISKQLAECLGGDLWVESQPAVGTTFTLAIPPGSIGDATMVDEQAVAKQEEAQQGTDALFEGKILVAEDDVLNRTLLERILEGYDVDILTVGDGGAAVDAILDADRDGKPFDLVLMDMLMPVVDGYAATSQVRHAGYRGPIVALTGNTRGEDREKCVRSGCDDYLAKPIDRTALESVLGRFAGRTND